MTRALSRLGGRYSHRAFGMWDGHRQDARGHIDNPPSVTVLYWLCWLLLAATLLPLAVAVTDVHHRRPDDSKRPTPYGLGQFQFETHETTGEHHRPPHSVSHLSVDSIEG